MKYYIIAGEASGDLHGSNLIKHLHQLDPSCKVRAWGGELMESAGANIAKHYRDLAFMGFVEVFLNLRTIFKNIDFCKSDIEAFSPDVLILIDYPGFNMRIAKWAKQKGIKVFYYISPQIWAWKQNRVHALKRDVDQMYVILPFEKEFYARFDMDVHFVGHPLLDAIADFEEQKDDFSSYCQKHQLDANKKIIALLPGSRKQEISKMLPTMLKMQKHFSNYQFVIAGAPSKSEADYAQFTQKNKVKIIFNQTYRLLQQSHAALVTSGTATLETALFNVPEVVCYKGSSISYAIAKKLIKVKYISLVNLIMDKEIVKELIQHDFNEKQLKAQLSAISNEGEYRTKMLENYQSLRTKLGGVGASENTAKHMLKTLKEGL